MKVAYLGIGGNIGDTKKNIEETIELLKKNDEIEVIRVSSFYETEPVGYTDQAWFLNVVVEIETSLEPLKLLDYCQHVENELKRERTIRWGPRTIDVDILLYEDFISDSEILTVPHPRMTERAFAMIPLYEINSNLLIYGIDIKQIVENLKGEQIRKANL